MSPLATSKCNSALWPADLIVGREADAICTDQKCLLVVTFHQHLDDNDNYLA